MKTQSNNSTLIALAGRLCASALTPLALAAMVVVFFGTFAQDASASGSVSSDLADGSRIAVPPPVPGGNGSLASDTDEGVGTLPIIIGPKNDPDATIADLLPRRVLSVTGLVQPFVEMTGYWDDVAAAVINATGKGVITVTPSNDLDGKLCFGFHGNIDLELDIEELRLRHLEPSINTGGEFDGGVSTICWNGNCTVPSALPSAEGLLSFGVLIDSGILMQSSVQLVAVSTQMSSVSFDFSLLSETSLAIKQRIQ